MIRDRDTSVSKNCVDGREVLRRLSLRVRYVVDEQPNRRSLLGEKGQDLLLIAETKVPALSEREGDRPAGGATRGKAP